jgi:hypothetical protein
VKRVGRLIDATPAEKDVSIFLNVEGLSAEISEKLEHFMTMR